jgi:lysophospholipase L1-like esterase
MLNKRWTGILKSKLGINVVDMGGNGRMIPKPGYSTEVVLRVIKQNVKEGENVPLWIMLGTNDILKDPETTAEDVNEALKTFVKNVQHSGVPVDIRIIAPVPMKQGTWADKKRFVVESEMLPQLYKKTAEELGVAFTDASEFGVQLAYDGVHFTEQGHRTFAEKMEALL